MATFYAFRVSCWTRLQKLLMRQAPTGCGAAVPIPTRNRPAKRVQHPAPASETGKPMFFLTPISIADCTSRGADLLKCKHPSRELLPTTTVVAAICVALFRLRGNLFQGNKSANDCIIKRAPSTAIIPRAVFLLPDREHEEKSKWVDCTFPFCGSPRHRAARCQPDACEDRSPPTSYLCLYL